MQLLLHLQNLIFVYNIYKKPILIYTYIQRKKKTISKKLPKIIYFFNNFKGLLRTFFKSYWEHLASFGGIRENFIIATSNIKHGFSISILKCHYVLFELVSDTVLNTPHETEHHR